MTPLEHNLSLVVVPLMKGVMYRDDAPSLWQSLLALQGRVYDYVSILGLELVLDEAEGYAYLRQRAGSERTQDAAAPELPRLVQRRQLGFGVSLLLALLRKKLAEFDAKTGDVRLIVSREEILDLMRLFMPDVSNEARAAERLDASIAKAVELGFLRPLQGPDAQYEVRRILKAFVDAQWLHGFDERLAQYRFHASSRD